MIKNAISSRTLHIPQSYCLGMTYIHGTLDSKHSQLSTLCVSGSLRIMWSWRFGKYILGLLVKIFLEFWLPTVKINKFSTPACQNGVGLWTKVKGRVNQQGSYETSGYDIPVQGKFFSNVKVSICRFLKQTNKCDLASLFGGRYRRKIWQNHN